MPHNNPSNPYNRPRNPFDPAETRRRQVLDAYERGVDVSPVSSGFVGPPEENTLRSLEGLPPKFPAADDYYVPRGQELDRRMAELDAPPEFPPPNDPRYNADYETAMENRAMRDEVEGMSLRDIQARNRDRIGRRPSMRDKFLASRSNSERGRFS